MIHAGEDPRFITRRLVIAAAEDVSRRSDGAYPCQCRASIRGIYRLPEARIPIRRSDDLRRDRNKSNTSITSIDAALMTFGLAARWRCRSICGTRTTGANASATGRIPVRA